ncbi:FkbM family methyltransferase [Dyadobacter bucti]|uniref:FkbM family methyltransferase n=1 Tax=Dyadobacter bucti TaxID=2572203 RepID=UPI0011091621|nr:FkbM family methyltransferase [Dyadobacter bucti]
MKLKTIQTILNHPLNQGSKVTALIRFLKRGILIRLHRFPIVYPFIENTFLIVEKGMASAELQIYTGLYDLNEMLFLMHFLREDDVFVDVGANVGVYSILASGVAGSFSIAYEPIPSTFGKLKRNVDYNDLNHKVRLLNLGVGDKAEKILFSDSLDAINHVIQEPGFKGSTMQVDVTTLDISLADTAPTFLKIDVEGFEANVIRGAIKILEKPELKVIIIETNGLSDKYDFGQNYIHNELIASGFSPFDYTPSDKKLRPLSETNPQNTIYVRDYAFVEKRLQTARKIRLNGILI